MSGNLLSQLTKLNLLFDNEYNDNNKLHRKLCERQFKFFHVEHDLNNNFCVCRETVGWRKKRNWSGSEVIFEIQEHVSPPAGFSFKTAISQILSCVAGWAKKFNIQSDEGKETAMAFQLYTAIVFVTVENTLEWCWVQWKAR